MLFTLSCILSIRPIFAKFLASPTPIILNIHKASSDIQGRSKPQLFQRILGIIPGKPFSFDENRLKALGQYDLFQNLTINTHQTDKGTSLCISGTELPSRKFSRGVSFSGSEIIGQVTIEVFMLKYMLFFNK